MLHVTDDFRNKRVTVLGLGRFGGGIAVARWLAEQGAKVLVSDRDPIDKLRDSVNQLSGLPIEFRLGEADQRIEHFTQTDYVVTSPAVKPTSEFLVAARNAGVPVTTEICLFIERAKGRFFGVTGTKGKSTTTALLGLLLASAGPCFVGGNIGKSLLFELPKLTDETNIVLELSSYMLHWLGAMRWSPDAACLTMLDADHLDWHGGADAYIDAKRNIARFQKPGSRLVRRDDTLSQTFVEQPGVEVCVYPDPKIPHIDLLIPGEHNQHNAQAALLASGLSFEARQVLKRFRGLPHRLELVHEADGVRYFNDSIATIPQAAIIACDAFEPKTVIQIIGGSPKPGLSWDAMGQHLSERCKHVLTIGQIGPDLAKLTPGAEYVETLDAAVARAKQIASSGDVVLLSPATASHDQFPNFEKRGERFAQLARG